MMAKAESFGTPPFVGLHNVAKHIIHLAEAVDSNLLVVGSAIERIKGNDADAHGSGICPVTRELPDSPQRIPNQLRERLLYRKSMFESTKLRLVSLQKRVDNAINLAFNTVTWRDSQVMMRDSSTMKAIAVITLFFLPATAIASVMGSQLFLADNSGGAWSVTPGPLFPSFWYVTASVTVAGFVSAIVWHFKLCHMLSRWNYKLRRARVSRSVLRGSSEIQP